MLLAPVPLLLRMLIRFGLFDTGFVVKWMRDPSRTSANMLDGEVESGVNVETVLDVWLALLDRMVFRCIDWVDVKYDMV